MPECAFTGPAYNPQQDTRQRADIFENSLIDATRATQ